MHLRSDPDLTIKMNLIWPRQQYLTSDPRQWTHLYVSSRLGANQVGFVEYVVGVRDHDHGGRGRAILDPPPIFPRPPGRSLMGTCTGLCW